jgi:AraC-like DNA-binding protein
MTPHANSLTDRVTKALPATGQTWSLPTNDARAFIRALGCLGYDADGLLAAAGLSPSDLKDPDARISCEKLGAIVTRAQQQRFTPNLGLEMARVTPLGAYPLLDYLVLTTESVAAGARQLARYYKLVGIPITLAVDESTEPIRLEVRTPTAPFSVEFATSLTILHFRHETEGRFCASQITFTHATDDPVAFERILGCPVRLASSNTISVPVESWQLSLRRRDPVLRQLLELQAEKALANIPTRTGLALEMQRALVSRVATGDTSIATLGREFAMSERTLQRRLAAEGTSYQELLDDARKEAAGRYLTESTLAIGEVAYLVGYSEPAPFHRAFKRWFGVTPDVFRRQKGQSALTPSA